MRFRAPAKINWFLTVLSKREDGYHDIMSLMQCISLYDDLVFEHSDIIEVISDLDIPLEDNLVYKAASLLKQYTSYRQGARIILKKNIPVSAGLGGGSSDAAYALSGLNILWGLGLSNGELSSIGIEIGSDVPFFLNGPSALVEGRGEKILPLKINTSILLLVKPLISVSTAWAYASFDKLNTGRLRMHGERSTERSRRRPVEPLTKKPVDIKLFCRALKKQDFASLNTMLNNDFERVIVERYPVVGIIKDRMLEKGAVISAMSGSGPTVFGVFDNRDTAEKAAKSMKPSAYGGWCRIVETL
ncbi:MAG: 4-(cytidine 5'-diphospho)-2-C-methyl-D-erythritol kinase [Nitrospirota bacterium]